VTYEENVAYWMKHTDEVPAQKGLKATNKYPYLVPTKKSPATSKPFEETLERELVQRHET